VLQHAPGEEAAPLAEVEADAGAGDEVARHTVLGHGGRQEDAALGPASAARAQAGSAGGRDDDEADQGGGQNSDSTNSHGFSDAPRRPPVPG
jgi:hypothetical protein